MTPAENLAQRLEATTIDLQGVRVDRYPRPSELDAAAMIRRLAAALIEFHAAYKAGGWAADGIEERHAEALRDIREDA